MTNLERLNTWHSVTLKDNNGQRCVIMPMHGCKSYSLDLYYKHKRIAFYSVIKATTSDALIYAEALGYRIALVI